MDISQFYSDFFIEANELLSEMERLLLGLNLQSPDSEELNAIFRVAHSIKGGAATFGFVALTETTHLLETLLDRARHGQLSPDGAMVKALLETKDALQEQLNAYQDGMEPDSEMVAHICAVLQKLALEQNVQDAELLTPADAPELEETVQPASVEIGAVAETVSENVLRVRLLKLSSGDGELLVGELENLGTVLSQSRSNDALTVDLETSCVAADIVAVCCFVIDESQIEVTPVLAGAAAPVGAAQNAPVVLATQLPVSSEVAVRQVANTPSTGTSGGGKTPARFAWMWRRLINWSILLESWSSRNPC